MTMPDMPAWGDDARCFYSEIGAESADPVSVFDTCGRDDVSNESPGELYLRLEPRSRRSPRMRVLDAAGREEGIIRPEGLMPGVSYAMSRDGERVWTLSVRSIVRKHHALEWANADSWTFDTPFYWWQHLSGTSQGALRLFGGVGPMAQLWLIWIEPGWDTFDMLAAVAFLHRQWWHW